MKAAFIERHGGPEVLKFGEMPDPVATSGEVVVDIVAASVNGADWKGPRQKIGPAFEISLRSWTGFLWCRFGGCEGVRDIAIGDEVFAGWARRSLSLAPLGIRVMMAMECPPIIKSTDLPDISSHDF